MNWDCPSESVFYQRVSSQAPMMLFPPALPSTISPVSVPETQPKVLKT